MYDVIMTIGTIMHVCGIVAVLSGFVYVIAKMFNETDEKLDNFVDRYILGNYEEDFE